MTEQLGTKGARVSHFLRIRYPKILTVVPSRVNLDNEVGKQPGNRKFVERGNFERDRSEGSVPKLWAYEAFYWVTFATSTLHHVLFIIVHVFCLLPLLRL